MRRKVFDDDMKKCRGLEERDDTSQVMRQCMKECGVVEKN